MAKNPVFNQATGAGVIANLAPAYGNGIFMTATAGAPGPAYVIVSTDYGRTWHTNPVPSTGDWGKIVFGAGKFILLESNNAASSNYWISANGRDWAPHNLPSVALWYCMAWVNDKFVAMQYGFAAGAYSYDGITWTTFNVPTGGNYRDVAYGNGQYLMVSDNGTGQKSSDGITWHDWAMPTDAYFAPAYGMGVWVILWTSIAFYSKDNGATWIQGANLPTVGPFYQVLFDQINGVFFCVSYGARTDAIYSEDGINWRLVTRAQGSMPSVGTWRGAMSQIDPQKYVYTSGDALGNYMVGDPPILRGTRFTASNFTRLLKAN